MAERKAHKRKKNVIRGRAIPMLSVNDISKKYDFHPHTIRAWVNKDGLLAERHGPGGKMFIRQDYVERFIQQWYEDEEQE